MAYQLSDLVTQVQNRVGDIGYPSSKITTYLNEAQREVFNKHTFRFMETSQNYTLSIGVADITNGSGLPADFQAPINLRITTDGYEKLVKPADYSWIDQQYPDPTSITNATPNYWYPYGSTINVLPAPEQAYTTTLRYLKSPTALSADDDVPEVPIEFQELLVVGASKRVLETKDNYDQAGVLQLKFDELLEDMVVRYGTKQFGTPNLMPINRRRTNAKNSIFAP